MTTWTIAQIVARFVEVIEELTPETTLPNGQRFALNRQPSRSLRRWVPDAGGTGMVRRFEIEHGARSDIGVQNFRVAHVTFPISITLCYPTAPNLYGYSHRHELEGLISGDAQQIRDALQAPAALAGSGHVANIIPDIDAPDRGDERVIYQDITAQAVFYTSVRTT